VTDTLTRADPSLAGAGLALGTGAAGAADYFALLKPRVMSLVLFTALVGLIAAPGHIHPVIAVAALLCVAVGAGAAGALNMWYDADIDARMERTALRPIPAGRIAPGEALGFGATLAVGSVVAMGLMVNLVAAALLALTIAFYLFVYTMWLKRRTPQNIVIGGAAGAFPPMIGWAAVTGDVGIESLILFTIIFLWTPPHFWALALHRCGDYARAGVPMLPVVSGMDETRRQILLYTLVLVPVSLLPYAFGFAGPCYAALALALGLVFLAGAVQVWRRRGETESSRWAMRLFGFSILYLFLLFAALLTEHVFGLPLGA
jgi:protoheme IX farnesyltransferase